MSRHDIATAREPELIVCSIDYDGCLSAYGPDDAAENMILHLHELLMRNSEANLVLMVGSARQSIISDLHHEWANKNGSCWIFLKVFLENFKSKYADLADRISLDPFLLEDIFREKSPGHHFNIRVDSFSEALCSEYYQRAAFFKNGIDIHWQDLTKKTLIYAQLHYIGMKHPGKKILFHFYDDRMSILNYLMVLYAMRVELIPSNFSLCLFNYVAGRFSGNIPLVISGVGYVDNDYSTNVKSLNERGWLNAHHVEISERVLSEPNLALAKHLYQLSTDQNRFMRRLREKWGQYVFTFLDYAFAHHEKMFIVETWLSSIVRSREVECIQHCLRYVHPNICVDYFIRALEKNDDVLAAAFLPAMLSVNLGEFSKNDITLILFSKKKYDWLNQLYASHDNYQSLIAWCRFVEINSLTKSRLRQFLDTIIFVDYKNSPLCKLLNLFCYHLSVLPGDALNEEAYVALDTILSEFANSNIRYIDQLWCKVISPFLSTDLLEMSGSREGIIQKYLLVNTAEYNTRIQAIIVGKIRNVCVNQIHPGLLEAYRALQFVILSISLPPDSVFDRLHEAISFWKISPSVIPGKTHLALLIDCDKKLQETALTSRPRSIFSFFCRCCDKDSVFSHQEFIDLLLFAAGDAHLTTERLVVLEPEL